MGGTLLTSQKERTSLTSIGWIIGPCQNWKAPVKTGSYVLPLIPELVTAPAITQKVNPSQISLKQL